MSRYMSQTRNNELLDNYFLFIHNIQIQQSNMTTLNTSIHNALYNLITTSFENEQIMNNRRSNSLYNRMNRNFNRREFEILNNIGNTPNRGRIHTAPSPVTSLNFGSFLNPVPVFPSSEQIENATIISSYGNLTRQPNSLCPIRNTEFDDNDTVIQLNHCGHIFYINEFYGWFRENVRCPLCRHDIRIPRDNNIELNNTESNNVDDNNETDISSNFTSSFTYNILDNSNISINNHFESSQINTMNEITRTLATELENQLRLPINNDISYANLELSIALIGDISTNSLL